MYVKQNIRLFIKLSDGHTYLTRNTSTLLIPKHKTSKFENCPEYNCVQFLHSLPIELREIQDLKKFKCDMRKFLIDTCFYSVDEFLNS